MTTSTEEYPLASIDLDAFRRDGYAVVRQLFSPEQAEEIRDSTIELVERLEREGDAVRRRGALYPKGDMLTYESLRRVLLDPRLIGAVREVLGGDPVFWGESSIPVGDFEGGARAWHTDAYQTPVTEGAVWALSPGHSGPQRRIDARRRVAPQG